MNEWTWLTVVSDLISTWSTSVRERDQSTPHAWVSRMLQTHDCCGRVVRSHIIPDWPRVMPQERHLVLSCYTPFNIFVMLVFSAPPAVIATPRRIYARLRTSPILVSDYAFAEEETGEIAERMSELLDVEVSEEDLDLDTEALPGNE